MISRCEIGTLIVCSSSPHTLPLPAGPHLAHRPCPPARLLVVPAPAVVTVQPDRHDVVVTEEGLQYLVVINVTVGGDPAWVHWVPHHVPRPVIRAGNKSSQSLKCHYALLRHYAKKAFPTV